MNSWNQWGVLLDQVALVDKTGAFISPGSPNSNGRKMKKQSQSKTQLAENVKWKMGYWTPCFYGYAFVDICGIIIWLI